MVISIIYIYKIHVSVNSVSNSLTYFIVLGEYTTINTFGL